MAMRKGYRQLVDEANAEVKALSPSAAAAMAADGSALLVDLRDPRELEIEGRIAGAKHCPRGMLEFWIDPDSPYHKDFFASGKPIVFFCAGGLRSALSAKTAQDMGLQNVAHIEGGMSAWKAAGLPVQPGQKRPD